MCGSPCLPPILGTGLSSENHTSFSLTGILRHHLLEEHGEVRERRNQRRHPNYTKPELLAEAPNQVWSWDITKLRGPVKWTYYYLYVILDIFSRYVVGWMLAHRESAALAQRLIAESCRKQDIEPDQLTLHADRGSSMRSKPVGLLLADLGINYHPQSGWFDEGPSKGPPPCGRGLKPPEVLLLLVFFLFLLVAVVVPNNGLV